MPQNCIPQLQVLLTSSKALLINCHISSIYTIRYESDVFTRINASNKIVTAYIIASIDRVINLEWAN